MDGRGFCSQEERRTSYGAVAELQSLFGVANLRAFIVEDNPLILKPLTDTLSELADIRVVGSAPDEASAMAWFGARSDGCDVAIIDVFLKAGSGLGVLQGMRGYAAPPRRAVLTNYPSPEIKSRAALLGAEAVFDKSTEIFELVEWLQQRGKVQ